MYTRKVHTLAGKAHDSAHVTHELGLTTSREHNKIDCRT